MSTINTMLWSLRNSRTFWVEESSSCLQDQHQLIRTRSIFLKSVFVHRFTKVTGRQSQVQQVALPVLSMLNLVMLAVLSLVFESSSVTYRKWNTYRRIQILAEKFVIKETAFSKVISRTKKRPARHSVRTAGSIQVMSVWFSRMDQSRSLTEQRTFSS